MLRGDDAKEYTRRGIPPSESGKRIEVVHVAMIWRDADGEMRTRISLRDIQRRPSGKVSGLSLSECDKPDHVEGRLMELLPPRAPTPEMRARTREMLDHWKRLMPTPPIIEERN